MAERTGKRGKVERELGEGMVMKRLLGVKDGMLRCTWIARFRTRFVMRDTKVIRSVFLFRIQIVRVPFPI